jgi:hypothetical protein
MGHVISIDQIWIIFNLSNNMSHTHEVYANFEIRLQSDHDGQITKATYDMCFFDVAKMSEKYFAWVELTVSEDEKNQNNFNNKRIILLKFLHQASRYAIKL